MAGTPVPGHVYDEIDTHLHEGRGRLAWEATQKAINDYQDPKLRIHNCLWLYYKGGQILADSNLEGSIAMWSKFLSLAHDLTSQGPHVLKVHLDSCQIRPPRSDEIAEAKRRLAAVEEALREKRLGEGATSEEVDAEIQKHKKSLLNQGKGCLVAFLLSPALLLVELFKSA